MKPVALLRALRLALSVVGVPMVCLILGRPVWPAWHSAPPPLDTLVLRAPDGEPVYATGVLGAIGFWRAGEWVPWGDERWAPVVVPG